MDKLHQARQHYGSYDKIPMDEFIDLLSDCGIGRVDVDESRVSGTSDDEHNRRWTKGG